MKDLKRDRETESRAHINCFSCKRSRIVQLYSVANTLRKILFFMCKIPLTNRIVTSPSPAPISKIVNDIQLNVRTARAVYTVPRMEISLFDADS